MGTSFIEIDNKGFWMNDSILEIWLRLLALHIPEPTNEDTNKEIIYSIRNQWLLMSRGYFTGHIHVGLAKFVDSPNGKEIILTSICSLIDALKTAPVNLSNDILNLLGIENGGFRQDIETASLIEVGAAFKNLLNGQITSDASSVSFMPGSKR